MEQRATLAKSESITCVKKNLAKGTTGVLGVLRAYLVAERMVRSARRPIAVALKQLDVAENIHLVALFTYKLVHKVVIHFESLAEVVQKHEHNKTFQGVILRPL